MKTHLLAIAVLALTTILCPSQVRAQQPQPLKYFGYAGPEADSDLSRVSSYTNFSYIAGTYNLSIIPQLTALKNRGMRGVVDLGTVLWCQDDPNNPYGGWHLCTVSDGGQGQDYISRWNTWVNANTSVLNGSHVLAFSVITEHTLRGISVDEVQTAASLVKQRYPTIPIMIVDNADDIYRVGLSYQVPNNVDWIGSSKYYVRPNSDYRFKQSVSILKSKKQSWQRMLYVLDGFYRPEHRAIAPTPSDMDTIAQEWYVLASQDPEAILLGVFIWGDIPGEGAIGSANMGSILLNKHAAIGRAILDGKFPNYQGTHDTADCQGVAGWAWDSSQPNTPVSVDIYRDGGYKLATIRASEYRQDLVNAGIGNGRHGFLYTLPDGLKDGQTHVLTVKYNGTSQTLNLTSKAITCSNPSARVAWVKPAEFSWGPANTMTVAGFAENGSGGVQMFWRDVTTNGGWYVVDWQPTPNPADNSWSNTIPSSNRCHTYAVYVNYAGVKSPTFLYDGLNSGYCNESAKMIWIQPQSTAGFGPPGSLIVAGSAAKAPPNTQVYVWYRDVTAGAGWVKHTYAPLPDSNGIWLMDIPNANFSHVYQVYAKYDAVTTSVCTYSGANSISWCQ